LNILESAARDAQATLAPGVSDADLRAKFMLLATQPSVLKRRQAIDIIEHIVRRQIVKSPEDRFVAAQLYDSVGDWAKTRSHMTELLSGAEAKLAKPFNETERKAILASYGSYLAFYSRILVRRHELNEATIYQAKLEQLEPNTFRSLDVKARLLHKLGKGEEAVPYLTKVVVANEALACPVASLLEEIGQVGAARTMLEQYVAQAKKPDAVLVLAAFLGRQNQPAEALKLCEAARKTCAPEDVFGTSVGIIYAAKSGELHAGQVAVQIEEAIARHPEKRTPLLNDLAALRRLQGRHEDAVAVLRKITAHDKGDPLSFNNLAWLLALTGKTDEALEAIQSGIALSGEQAKLLDTRAVVYITKGQPNFAVHDLEAALAETPTAERYFHLARAHLGAGNPGAAAAALAHAKELGLNESSVDPLERQAYRQLIGKLDRP
jgi:tetratricopeptide (TPR) repeat protein